MTRPELPARKTAEERYKANQKRHYRFDWKSGRFEISYSL